MITAYFQCVIALDKNVLRIEDSVETSFLPESELPLHARLTGNTPGSADLDRTENPLQSAAAASGKLQAILFRFSSAKQNFLV